MFQIQVSTVSRSAPKNDRQLRENMDFSFVTERIIALYFPENVTPQAFHQGHGQAAHLLSTKHANNYMDQQHLDGSYDPSDDNFGEEMTPLCDFTGECDTRPPDFVSQVFNLTEPRRSARSQHARVRELNWVPGLAPPLDKLCSICKEIETWLNGDSHRVAVLHARGNRERIGVVVASFMHYSNICGTADQALDRFAMEKFLDDKIQELEQPSQRRYVDYFAGLLSGNIRINSAPLYLTHITVLGAPAFEANTEGVVCRAFIKIYEGLMPVYTSGVHRITPGTRQFTVNVAGDRRNQGLQLRGDVLVKCYHKHPNQREVIFACQFHTCTISDYTLSFTRHELDSAAYDLRFPLDGAVEFHFSASPTPRLPLPAPTPAVAVDSADDPIVRWDSYADLLAGDHDSEMDHHGRQSHLYC
ncbi:hypothetical protein RUM44_007063 [Polyplax serrata]|uniref:Tensin n=1 Tax=Polyplax serrata TaxID=468196 RepID=A0ABR1AZP5_POLSC